MRVVKAYVREDYEKKKFDFAAEDVQKDFTKAERILALNNPLMQFCIYVVMIFVMAFGSYTVITSQGLDLDVGQMSSLLTYSFQILMSANDGLHDLRHGHHVPGVRRADCGGAV